MAHKKKISLLIAEDDPDHRMFIEEALEEEALADEVQFVTDGQELLDCLCGEGKYSGQPCMDPTLILLDLNMPKKDGREALREIKQDARFKHIPVVIFTASKADEDILESYNYGASGYVSKPVTYKGLLEVMQKLKLYWRDTVALP